MSIRPRRLALRAVTVLTAAGAVVLLTGAPAFAHVTAQPGQAEQGGYGVVSLRVPTESDSAGTVALQVTPARRPPHPVRAHHPEARLDGRPAAQRRDRHRRHLERRRRRPDRPRPVRRLRGPLPTDTLVLPAVQTHDDGEVVAWDQPPNPDRSEPDRPPTVELVPAEGSGARGPGRGVRGDHRRHRPLDRRRRTPRRRAGPRPGGGAVLQNRRTRSTR